MQFCMEFGCIFLVLSYVRIKGRFNDDMLIASFTPMVIFNDDVIFHLVLIDCAQPYLIMLILMS